MQEIFNEGRVVGLSAYEVYVRHHMEEYGDDPNNPPASEREWLASSISLGTSILLKITPETTNYSESCTVTGGDLKEGEYWGIEITLPTRSRLCAANTIIGSIFLGAGVVDDSYPPLCKSVSDYGLLSSDTRNSSNYYYGAQTSKPRVYHDAKYYDTQVHEYMKLIDGVVVAQCTDYSAYIPKLKDGQPKIRLLFRSKVQTAFFLLLSGFSDESIISGISSVATGSLKTPRPQAGDFLGPSVFPWSAKIILTTPTAAISRLYANKLARFVVQNSGPDYSGVEGGSTDIGHKVKTDALIDFNYAYMEKFYEGSAKLANKLARCRQNVTEYAPIGDGVSQLAAFSRDKGVYDAPALYGSQVTAKGYSYLYPIDCAAPGTVKIFPELTSDAELKAFKKNRPGCYALIKSITGLLDVDVDDDGHVNRSPIVRRKFSTFKDADGYSLKKSGNFTNTSGQYAEIDIGSSLPIRVPLIQVSNKDFDGKIIYEDTGYVWNRDYVENITSENANQYASEYNFADKLQPLNYDIVANYISLRTLNYAIQNNKRIDVLGFPLKTLRMTMQVDSNDNANGRAAIQVGGTGNYDRTLKFRSPLALMYDKSIESYGGWGNWLTHVPELMGGYQLSTYGIESSLRVYNSVRNNYDAVAFGLGIDGTKNGSGYYNRPCGYMRMLNGLRLYVSTKEPKDSDIPDGSIGVGW